MTGYDAKPVDAAIILDAGRDAQPPVDPTPLAPVIWERFITGPGTVTPASLYDAVMLPSGVAVLATPNFTLFDQAGTETARILWPGVAGYNSGAGLMGALARADGDRVTLLLNEGDVALRDYSAVTLAEGVAMTVDECWLPAAVAELDGVVYALSYCGQLKLHEIRDGAVETTPLLPAGEIAVPTRRGYGTADGRLVFCVLHSTDGTVGSQKAEVLRIDPTGPTFTSLDIGPVGSAERCQLVRGPDNYLAYWSSWISGVGTIMRWTLVSLDGTTVLAGPIDGPPQLFFDHATHDGGQYVGIGRAVDYWESVHIYPIDDDTGELLPPSRVPTRPGEYLLGNEPAIASDGVNSYVAVSMMRTDYGATLRLLKLEPLFRFPRDNRVTPQVKLMQ